MSIDKQASRARVMLFILFLSATLGVAWFGALAVDSAQAGNGTADEILVFNRGSKSSPFTVTKAMSGFIMDQPPKGAA